MLLDLYSKRRKRERGEFSDVYQYEDMPNAFRVQVVHMLEEAFAMEAGYFSPEATNTIKQINDFLRREYGVFRLAGQYGEGFKELADFLLQTEDYEKALDVIELTFRVIDRSIRNNLYHYNQRLGGVSNPLICNFLSVYCSVIMKQHIEIRCRYWALVPLGSTVNTF